MPASKVVQPHLRLALTVIGIAVTFFMNDLFNLFIFWILIFIGPGIGARIVRTHLIFVLVVCLPIFVGSLVIHAASQGAIARFLAANPPVELILSAAVVTARVAVVGLILQTFFLPLLPGTLLIKLLRRYGLRGQALMIIAGSLALVDDIKMRVKRISESYRARGLMAGSRWKQLLRTAEYLRPLFVSVLATAVTRGDSWQNREMLLRIEEWRGEPIQTDYILSALLLVWVVVASAIFLFSTPDTFNAISIRTLAHL